MADIFILLYLILSLHASGIDTTEPAFVHEIIHDAQVYGIDAAIEKVYEEIPEMLEKAEKDSKEALPEDTQDCLPGNEPGAERNMSEAVDYANELKKLGFYKDESKDEALNLRNAVLRFQSSCNLTADGIWGNKSSTALSILLDTGRYPAEDAIEAPPSNGLWIVINKSKRILTLYENKSVIKKYPIAIGNPPSLTPNDKFTIVSKVINPAWGGGGYAKPVKGGIPENPLGYRWMGLSYKSGSDLGIHGNNSPYSIGRNVSHGCIRMINSDVEELFEIVRRNMHVWIGTDAKLKEWGIEQKDNTSTGSRHPA